METLETFLIPLKINNLNISYPLLTMATLAMNLNLQTHGWQFFERQRIEFYKHNMTAKLSLAP